MSVTGQTASRQLLGLDVVRFSAAAMVMAFHLADTSQFERFTWWGWIGVEIFFVLSGFVIAYTAASATSLGFLRSRIVRLMPGVWICGTITAALLLVLGTDALPQRYLDTLVLWPVGPWVEPVYWTLPVEIVFYAAIFLLLAFRLYHRVGAMLWVMAVASTVFQVAKLINQFRPGLWFIHWMMLIPDVVSRFTFLNFGPYFALGGGLWLCFFQRATLSRLALIGVATVGCVIQNAFACRGFSAHTSIAFAELIWIAAMAAIVLSVWANERLMGWFGRYAGAVRLIGLATYPLYLVHLRLGVWLRDLIAGACPPAVAVTASCLAMMALSLVIARYLEPRLQAPLRAALQRLEQRLSRAGPAEAAASRLR